MEAELAVLALERATLQSVTREASLPPPTVLNFSPYIFSRYYQFRDHDTQAQQCGICLDAKKNITFSSCGHQVCVECSEMLDVCPFCDRIISDKVRIYAS